MSTFVPLNFQPSTVGTLCNNVFIAADRSYEEPEEFLVSFSVTQSAVILLPNTVKVTIQDDDSKGDRICSE